MKKRSRIIPVLCTLLVATFLFGTVSATNISMIGNTVTEPPLTQEELEHISECNALIEQQLARDNLTRAIYNNYLSMSVITQENGYYCGPATACMVAKTLGLGTYTQKEMASLLGTTTSGTSGAQICKTACSLKLRIHGVSSVSQFPPLPWKLVFGRASEMIFRLHST